MMLEIKKYMAAHQGSLQFCPGRRSGVHFDFHCKGFIDMRRKPQIEEQARKTHEGMLNRLLVADFESNFIPLGFQIPPDRLDADTMVIFLRISFQGKTQVFRIALTAVEETQGRSAVEGERHQRAGALHALQDQSLKIFTGLIASLNWIGLWLDQGEKMFFNGKDPGEQSI